MGTKEFYPTVKHLRVGDLYLLGARAHEPRVKHGIYSVVCLAVIVNVDRHNANTGCTRLTLLLFNGELRRQETYNEIQLLPIEKQAYEW